MTYYLIESHTGRILENYESEPDVEKEAQYFECDVYAIRGEHSGLSAAYRPSMPDPAQMIITLNQIKAWLEIDPYLKSMPAAQSYLQQIKNTLGLLDESEVNYE